MSDPSDPQSYDQLRQAFIEADTRFQQSMATAFTAHAQGVAVFNATLMRIERREADLAESIAALQTLVMEQGRDLRALKQRLDGEDT